MGRISDSYRARNENAIRAAMDRLMRGELPPGGKCDLKTLARESGVTRTGFYPKKNREAHRGRARTSTWPKSSSAGWPHCVMPAPRPTHEPPRSNASRIR